VSREEDSYDDFVSQHEKFATHFEGLYGRENVVSKIRYEYIRTVEVKFPAEDDLPAQSIVFQFIWYADTISRQQVIQISSLSLSLFYSFINIRYLTLIAVKWDMTENTFFPHCHLLKVLPLAQLSTTN